MCFWEDDPDQLRHPLSDEGANAISLARAQEAYLRHGAMHTSLRRKVRRARADEPLDPGWRPFDIARDWNHPVLDGDRVAALAAASGEALYYWRPAYGDAEQHRPASASRSPNARDRLVDHLRHEVPELREAIADSERRSGRADAWEACAAAAALALRAYARGDEELGDRILGAVAPALDEQSQMYAPNCVAVAFLEDERWFEHWVQRRVERWPASIREERCRKVRHRAARAAHSAAWSELWRTSRGRPIDRVRADLLALRQDDPRFLADVMLPDLLSRVMSDPRWLYRHPVDSVRLAWDRRAVWPPRRTLSWLRRPRIAG